MALLRTGAVWQPISSRQSGCIQLGFPCCVGAHYHVGSGDTCWYDTALHVTSDAAPCHRCAYSAMRRL